MNEVFEAGKTSVNLDEIRKLLRGHEGEIPEFVPYDTRFSVDELLDDKLRVQLSILMSEDSDSQHGKEQQST